MPPRSRVGTADRPFGCPDDVVLELPRPISVNKSRRNYPAGDGLVAKWVEQAHKHVLAGGGMKRLAALSGRFEAILIIDEELNDIDLDNSPKHVIDYARLLKLIVNDNKKHMRRVTIEWGKAPTGCKLILRPVEAA